MSRYTEARRGAAWGGFAAPRSTTSRRAEEWHPGAPVPCLPDSGDPVKDRNLHAAPPEVGDDPACSDGSTATRSAAVRTGETLGPSSSRAEYMRKWRQEYKERTGQRIVKGRFTDAPRKQRAPGDEPPHGTVARYYWSQANCHCRNCKDAVNAYHRGETTWAGDPR